MEPEPGVLPHRLVDRLALADGLVDLLIDVLEDGVAGGVLVMCRASRMGTPLATRVPRVRTLRATEFFSTNWPKIGSFKANMSQPIRPAGTSAAA